MENRFDGLMELDRTWIDRIATIEADKEVVDKLLKAVEVWERKYKEEISRLKAELASAQQTIASHDTQIQ